MLRAWWMRSETEDKIGADTASRALRLGDGQSLTRWLEASFRGSFDAAAPVTIVLAPAAWVLVAYRIYWS